MLCVMASQDLPSVEQECSPSFSRNPNAPSSTVDSISEADCAVTNLQQIFPSKSMEELAEIMRSSSSLEDATNRILDCIHLETILLERGTTHKFTLLFTFPKSAIYDSSAATIRQH